MHRACRLDASAAAQAEWLPDIACKLSMGNGKPGLLWWDAQQMLCRALPVASP